MTLSAPSREASATRASMPPPACNEVAAAQPPPAGAAPPPPPPPPELTQPAAAIATAAPVVTRDKRRRPRIMRGIYRRGPTESRLDPVTARRSVAAAGHRQHVECRVELFFREVPVADVA